MGRCGRWDVHANHEPLRRRLHALEAPIRRICRRHKRRRERFDRLMVEGVHLKVKRVPHIQNTMQQRLWLQCHGVRRVVARRLLPMNVRVFEL